MMATYKEDMAQTLEVIAKYHGISTTYEKLTASKGLCSRIRHEKRDSVLQRMMIMLMDPQTQRESTYQVRYSSI